MFKKTVALLLGFITLVSPALSFAATIPGFPGQVPLPPLAANTLPVVSGTSWTGVQSITQTPGSNQLVINQNQPQAIINWNSFNIGAAASVRFNQGTGTPGTAGWTPNSSYVALNRIYDLSPSLIYGSLTADGRVYLINQNGILFGPNSQLNVNTLVASTFNISNDDLRNGLLRFTGEDYQHFNAGAAASNGSVTLGGADPNAMIVNQGIIATKVGGSVYLIAPRVVNSGSIIAPSGIIGLVAATPGSKYLVTPETGFDGYTVSGIASSYDLQIADVNDHLGALAVPQSNVILNLGVIGGEADNLEGGKLVSDSGFIGMYGQEVNQNGLVQAITSVKTGGMIELLASDKVTLGPNSLTTCPISDSTETADPSFIYQPGKVIVGGFNNLYLDADSGLLALAANPAKQITLQGSIVAPAGNVTLEASDRIFLDTTSRIDVSGLWVDETVSSSLISAQLNSVQLRDDYGQKGGVLQGTTVTFDSLAGSSIGAVSSYLNAADLTAREKSTQGGTISLGSNTLQNIAFVNDNTTGEIIVKPGAQINFAGGGFSFQGGPVDTTKLVSGNTVYDISNAPEWVGYDQILGTQQQVNSKFGVTNTFTGLYLGGATALMDNSPGYLQGSDAGTTTLLARQIVLDGTLNGSATRGAYQNLAANPTNSYGLMQPAGGTLILGSGSRTNSASQGSYQDFVVNDVEISGSANLLPAGFGANDALPVGLQGKTVLSADVLNQAGLSALAIYANTGIAVDSGAKLALSSFARTSGSSTLGGTVLLQSRSVDVAGEIDLPAGSVTLAGVDNITGKSSYPAYYQPLSNEEVLLESGSKIDVSGQKVDNSRAGVTAPPGNTAGGSITLSDNTLAGAGVLVRSGATLDVSGGYTISGGGKITGGDAGSITLSGMNLLVNGTLRGVSLLGNQGGGITFQSDQITVSSNGPVLPDNIDYLTIASSDLLHGLLLNSNVFADTGFTRIALLSYHDLTVEGGATLAPSLTKLAAPVPGGATNTADSSATLVSQDLAGTTSVILKAGVVPPSSIDGAANTTDNTALLHVAANAGVTAAPGGTVSLQGPNLTIDGTLTALAGTVSATLSYDKASAVPASSELVIGPTGRIFAQGYNKAIDSLVAGKPAGYSALAGGNINLTALPDANAPGVGDIVVSRYSVLDVSGSQPAPFSYLQQNGKAATVNVASNPGTIAISYGNTLVLDGELLGKANAPGVQGGTLTLANPNPGTGLTVSAADLSRYLGNGFDSFTFLSQKAITFSGTADLNLGRGLTLDAPVIAGSGSDDLTLSAASITLRNSYYPANPDLLSTPPSSGLATLALKGGVVTVAGGVLLSGYQNVDLEATGDIMLNSSYYNAPIANLTALEQGLLETAGNLTLRGARIYPTTQSDFTIQSDSGAITILPGVVAPGGSIYSAFGTLTLNANGSGGGIDQQGYLAAPLGVINLNSSGRILLEPGSVTTAAGEVAVPVGSLDSNFTWTRSPDNGTTLIPVTGPPQKAININGKEVLVANGAEVNLSGGGSVYTDLFSADAQGSVNPLTKSGVYVILPDNSVTLPGNAVYLSGNAGLGLKAGVYSLLPADQFGFVPGALVVSKLNTPMAPTDSATTQQGYQVVAGYPTYAGSGVTASLFTGYTVRRASDVLLEGHFDVQQLIAGDAGSLAVNGPTTVLDGSLKAAALVGYQGGSVSLSATNITVQAVDAASALNLDFTTPLTQDLVGTLVVNASTLSGQGFEQVQLGSLAGTSSLTLKGGALLAVPQITLASGGSLTLEAGSTVQGMSASGTGVVTLLTNGNLSIGAGAVVHASDMVNLTATTLDYHGTLLVDHGALNLTANNKLYLVKDEYLPTEADSNFILYLPQTLWSTFGTIGQLTLAASGSVPAAAVGTDGKTQVVGSPDIVFKGDLSIGAGNSLTLDAGRIAGDGSTTLQANSVTLKNSGKVSAATTVAAVPGTLSVDAGTITIEVGNTDDTTKNWGLTLDDFKTVNLNATHDLTFQGVGTLTTGADLNLAAARITTGVYGDSEAGIAYQSANVTVNAQGGSIGIAKSGGTAGGSTVAGGTLVLEGSSITDAGIIEVPSGSVTLAASGLNGIVLTGAAQLLARGSMTRGEDPSAAPVYTPGGMLALNADSGPLTLAAGSLLDVSANGVGDAGGVTLSAPGGSVNLLGTIQGNKGSAALDLGGTFFLDARQVDGKDGGNTASTLARLLSAGGFDQQIGIRARQGDVTVLAGDTLSAASVTLTADAGAIEVSGTINANATGGGRVVLEAGGALTLESGSTISARGMAVGASGGTVVLSSTAGAFANIANATVFNGSYALQVQSGSVIDVSGTADSSGAVVGGTVAFRAFQGKSLATDATLDDLNMAAPAGVITGAAQVTVEAARSYQVTGNIGSDTGYMKDATSFLAFSGAASTRLFGSASSNPNYTVDRLLPGIELDSTGNLTLNAAWDLTQGLTAGKSGVLTLRSAENLNINANLVDHPSGTIITGPAQASWGINLVAGADLNSADTMAVNRNSTGVLNVGSSVNGTQTTALVYTEAGALNFASAGDTVLNGSKTVTYSINSMYETLATYSGSVTGAVGQDLLCYGGVIQSATGVIDLSVAGNLELSSLNSKTGYGAIRTTGAAPSDFSVNKFYSNFSGGGTISISAVGDISVDPAAFSDKDFNAWDSNRSLGSNIFDWSANYDNSYNKGKGFFTQGFTTMGGGDLKIRTGGDFSGQAGTFGLGNLSVVTGGDSWGRFLVAKGNGTLDSMGNIGRPAVVGGSGISYTNPYQQPVIELGGYSSPAIAAPSVQYGGAPLFTAQAQGGIYLGTVLNPTLSYFLSSSGNAPYWDPTYAQHTDLTLTALGGGVSILGKPYFYTGTALNNFYSPTQAQIFPQSLEIASAGDVTLYSNIVLAPSTDGNLRIEAAGNILGEYRADYSGNSETSAWVSLSMSDASLSSFYAPSASTKGRNIPVLLGVTTHGAAADNSLLSLHAGDDTPVVISAGGNLSALQIITPKQSEISAVGDIADFFIATQNNSASDVTVISAGKDIIGAVSPDGNSTTSGFLHAGPGNLIITAGGSIDLGSSTGVQEIGNQFNQYLPTQGSDVTVFAGAAAPVTPAGVNAFFDTLRTAGDQYSNLLAQGDTADAQLVVNAVRKSTIEPFTQGSTTSSGNISMISSSISTNSGTESLNIIATGQIDVGRTSLDTNSTANTGIYSATGGAINIFSGGDLNVNQSRVMTFFGGDITAWSDTGSINAGRGSKTAVNAQPPKQVTVLNPTTGKFETHVVFTPPSVGSGIRAVTYDPNTVPGGSLAIPSPGDISLFAPKGAIDAGEAGIAGGKVTLGATEVLNAKNISFSAGSVGVPTSSEGSVSIGAMSGAGSVAENSKMIEQSSTLGTARDAAAAQNATVDDFMSQWLDLRIISFDSDEAPASDGERKTKKK